MDAHYRPYQSPDQQDYRWDGRRGPYQDFTLDYPPHPTQRQRPLPQNLPPLRVHGSQQAAELESPISFASRLETSAAHHARQPPPQHAFLNEPPPASAYPSSTSGRSANVARSTFSVDGGSEDRSSVKSKGSGGGKLLKRVMKELTGGNREQNLPDNYVGQKKDKLVTYGRGGAGRIKKKQSAPAIVSSKSTTSLALSDDMKTLKSASSSAATQKPVFDPYLKAMVGPGGMPITAHAPPSVATSIPAPLDPPTSFQTPPSSARSPTTTTTSLSRSMTGSTRAGSAYTSGITTASSYTGWDGDADTTSQWSTPLSAPHRSRENSASAPPSAFPGGYGGPSWGVPQQHRDPSGRRPPSDASLRPQHQTPFEPSLSQIPSPPPAIAPSPGLVPNGLTPELAAVYAALLNQQSQGAPTPAGPAPIVPAENLNAIFAAAAAYHQIASSLAAAAYAPSLNLSVPTPAQTVPTSVPLPIPSPNVTSEETAVLNALASYSIQPSTSTSSSPGSSSALSPPPRHRQAQRGRNSSSAHGHPSDSAFHVVPPERKESVKPPSHPAPAPASSPSFQNRPITPPPTDDEIRERGKERERHRQRLAPLNSDLLSSKVSFNSAATPSPAPSAQTFFESTGAAEPQSQPSMLPYRNDPNPALAGGKPTPVESTKEYMDTAAEVARLEKTLRELTQMKHKLSSDSLKAQSARRPATTATTGPTGSSRKPEDEETRRRKKMALPPLPPPGGPLPSTPTPTPPRKPPSRSRAATTGGAPRPGYI